MKPDDAGVLEETGSFLKTADISLDEMEARIDEIKSMDFGAMSREERKEIREELKEMKAEAKATGNGVYLSVGAIIIILLLLILIL